MSGEMFALLGWVWDVDHAEELALQYPVRLAAVRELVGAMGFVQVDPVRAVTVDLSRPLVMVPLPFSPEPENHLVINGWHRIYRALREEVEELPAVLLSPEDERACRLLGGGI